MLRMRNKYCSNCLSTQRFLDLGTWLVCERCSKRLERVEPVAEAEADPVPAAERPGARIVVWAEHTEKQREAI